jgi:glycyl-tRNA synthetase
MAQDSNELMDKLVALCKRRGFIFQSSEIYGGINGFWDYGPLGVELKRNVKEAWWEDIVRRRDNVVGLDCSIIMNPKVWEASGHLSGFSDPMVDCKQCKARFRADQFTLYQLHPVNSVPDEQFPTIVHANEWASQAGRGLGPTFVANPDASTEDLQRLVRHKTGDKRAKLETRGVAYFATTHAGEHYWLSPTLSQPCKPGDHCPVCWGELTEARKFNLMLKTFIGAMEDSSSVAYLRPETAQGIFCNYKNVLDTSRMKVPFGIAQIGKSFRNEINPRNYTFRSREFEQMEIEFFCHPNEADKWYTYWRDTRYQWYVGLGLTSSKLHLRDHEKAELAHYARACADVEYEFPFGTAELEGIANRTDFDLSQHQKFSGKDLTYFDDETKERFVPYVIEPSGGVDRATLAFLCEAYHEDQAPDENGVMQSRVVMRFHPRLAPVKLAVFPLVKKDGMPEIARRIYEDGKKAGLSAFYDEKGAVGRRYRRQDEAGTPYCVTVDGQTIQDQTVTIRERDSLKQERIPADRVVQLVQERIA